MKENVIEVFKGLNYQISRYKTFQTIGYLTTPVLVGFIILWKVNPALIKLFDSREKVIRYLERFVKDGFEDIRGKFQEILVRDAYLIYDDKANILDSVGSFIKKIEFVLSQERYLPDGITMLSLDVYKKSEKIHKEITQYNNNFVKHKKLEYAELFKRKDLTLDDDQQTAIIIDDKHNLIVAGAGSGKTEVLITKIAYLIKRKSDSIKPTRILALAFQTKAANEMKERLFERYKLDVEIRTFHSLGQKIQADSSKIKGLNMPQLCSDCETDVKFSKYIQRLYQEELAQNKVLQNDVIKFMQFYGDDQIVKDETDFNEKEEFYNYQRNLKYTALNGTQVKSESERRILNFFLMHNLNGKKINIIYEHPAEWMEYTKKDGIKSTPKPDFYFPDFDIYLEHWAIGKSKKVPDWFSGKNPTQAYTINMMIKKKKYSTNKKTLIETSQWDVEENRLEEELEKKFIKALRSKNPDQKYELTSITHLELVEKVWDECKVFVQKISHNISKYITVAKTYRLYPDDIKARLTSAKWSPKQTAFSEIACLIYERYQQNLDSKNEIDFSDMINRAVDVLQQNPELYSNEYDYILIDEFQDISTQRYELISALINKNSKCKLFCVGDDWQSIMGFAGSNLNFFLHFDNYFSHPQRTDLTVNYRSIKSIVDIGACIIKNNKGNQIEKKTTSKSKDFKKVSLYSSLHQAEYYRKYYEQVAKHCLDKIKEYKEKYDCPYSDFMVLMRIATDKQPIWQYIDEYAQKLEIPILREFHAPNRNSVRFMSVHRSKGLQARFVFILNLDKGLYGFPCELENPDIFYPAMKNNDNLREQEERRLFYVAVTRAKEEVIMYSQKCSESQFITEIKDFVVREELRY